MGKRNAPTKGATQQRNYNTKLFLLDASVLLVSALAFYGITAAMVGGGLL